jgi:hypothetical protein
METWRKVNSTELLLKAHRPNLTKSTHAIPKARCFNLKVPRGTKEVLITKNRAKFSLKRKHKVMFHVKRKR